MSRKNRLFSPRGLRRVANAVEWEDDLRFYPDGTTNQEMYMAALALLWERWVREWNLLDFQSALADPQGGIDFYEGFKRIIETFPARIMQLRGFYEGLWWGANPEWTGPAPRLIHRRAIGPGETYSVEDKAMYLIQAVLAQIRATLE